MRPRKFGCYRRIFHADAGRGRGLSRADGTHTPAPVAETGPGPTGSARSSRPLPWAAWAGTEGPRVRLAPYAAPPLHNAIERPPASTDAADKPARSTGRSCAGMNATPAWDSPCSQGRCRQAVVHPAVADLADQPRGLPRGQFHPLDRKVGQKYVVLRAVLRHFNGHGRLWRRQLGRL